jgi:hypothetical protein
MCFTQPKPPRPPKPPPLPPAPAAPTPPPTPAPAPKAAQPVGSQPDLRVGSQKRAESSSRNKKTTSSSLRSSLNIGGTSTGGLNS